jgi:hypothetical protein
MEWWILLGLASAVLGIGAVTRIRRPRRPESERETETIYPLW